MAFENDTNAGRVQKMVETFGLIEKSALSNRADADALQAMIRPLIDALIQAGIMRGGFDAAEGLAKPTAVLTAGQRAAMRLADQASLRGLTAALLGRLEAHEARLSACDAAIDDGGERHAVQKVSRV